jgi:hypothetical protein
MAYGCACTRLDGQRRAFGQLARGAVLTLVFLVTGCVAFPQLDSLSRTASEPRRKKVREHEACLAASESQQDLLDCMDARGYRFIQAGIDQRAQECYSYRNTRTEYPAAYCFEVEAKQAE